MPSPRPNSLGTLRASVDWFLPPQAQQLTQLQRWRLRMAVGTSLLIPVLLVVPLMVTATSARPLAASAPALFTMLVLTASALACRSLGAVRVPGLVLAIYPVVASLVESYRNPDLTQYAVVLPLLAGFFGGRRMALVATASGRTC